MKKIKDVKEYVEKLDEAKKMNPKDLSSDQDLTIAIMNLISIEEHLVFSGAKTEKTSYYDLIEQIRELRKSLMQKIIPQYEGEVWCISKHLLASAMRLMEVGTKQQNLGNKEDAYKLFNQSYELYCLFWGLNMNLIKVDEIKWSKDEISSMENISSKIYNNDSKSNETLKINEDKKIEKKTFFSSLKTTVRKLVDCCIE